MRCGSGRHRYRPTGIVLRLTPLVDSPHPPPPPASRTFTPPVPIEVDTPPREMAAQTRQFTNPEGYSFPTHRLQRVLRDSSKQPLVLVACGSFSPITYLHLRMFEMARDYARQQTEYEIVGGYLSPVSDMYKKPGLLSAKHR